MPHTTKRGQEPQWRPAMDHIGIDVHKNASQVCIRTETGQLIERQVRTDRESFFKLVPPQNPVDRTIVDVSALGVKLAYPDASPAVRPARHRRIEPEAAARTRSADPRFATAAGHCAPNDISPRNTSLS